MSRGAINVEAEEIAAAAIAAQELQDVLAHNTALGQALQIALCQWGKQARADADLMLWDRCQNALKRHSGGALTDYLARLNSIAAAAEEMVAAIYLARPDLAACRERRPRLLQRLTRALADLDEERASDGNDPR